MLERAGKVAIPMLFFVGIPFLFAGPVVGIVCWLLAAILAIVLFSPARGWLGIKAPAKNVPVADRPRAGVVVADDSSDILVEDSDGYGVPVVDTERSGGVRVARSRSWKS
jgi:hypothetical protein